MQSASLEGYNLSIQQTRLWSLQRKSKAYHALCALSLRGSVDKELFEQVLQHVVQRHEILRTFFSFVPGIDVPVQVIADRPAYSCSMVDLQFMDASRQQQEIENWLASLQATERDLQQLPLLHCWLVHLCTDRYVWIICLPALCADAATLQLLVREFQRLYTACFQAEQLDDDPLQYADVSAWQDGLLQKEEAVPQLHYWQEKDFSLLHTTSLPGERSQSGNSFSTAEEVFRPQRHPIALDDHLARQIQALAENQDVSISALFLACWQIVLRRLGVEPHFLVGVSCDGRIYEEMANAFGLYTRFVPVDALFKKDLPFERLLADVAHFLEESIERQTYFTWETARSASEQSLDPLFFPLCFEYEYWPETFIASELELSLLRRSSCSEPYFLKLSVLQRGTHLQLELAYDQERVRIEQVQRLAMIFPTLLLSVVEQPAAQISMLRLLQPEMLDAICKAFQAPTRPLPEQTLNQLFEAHAARFPQWLALITSEEQLTYQELNHRANQLAHLLRRQGVRANVPVCLCFHRSAHMIVSLLAILKAGGAYVPLDPESPPERLIFQLQDTRAVLLLTQQALEMRFSRWEGNILCLETVVEEIQQEPVTDLPPMNDGQDSAYILYTSGSTGVPKGVCVLHKSVVNYTLAMCELLQSQPGWHYATVSTLAADLGNTSIFCALASGGCMHVPDYQTITSGDAFALWVAQHPIDVLKIVPSHLQALLTAQQSLAPFPRQALILGGEEFPYSLLRLLRERNCRCTVYNHYGPTEATIGTLVNDLGVPSFEGKYAELEAEGGVVPLGRPLTNSESYVLDRGGQIVPIGVTGELYLAGVGLALGYVHRPELTAECFIPHPFSSLEGARLYRTGDLACYRSDGTIEFLGRQDEQVKLRGYRIELGEIEKQLREIEGIRDAVVQLWREEGREAFLAGYVVLRQKQLLLQEEIQRALRTRIPEYMVPAILITLKQLPLTANGKLDRKRLPPPSQKEAIGNPEGNPEELYTPIEEMMAGAWQELLGIKKIGRTENFFQLGGHSLLGMRLIARLRAVFGVEVPITQLFESPTLSELAAHVEALVRGGEQGALPPLEPVDRSGALPLSYAQQRLWFLHQLDPQSNAYNVPGAVRLQGALDVAAFRRSFKILVQRHESLRTTFEERNGQPVQQVMAKLSSSFTVVDLSRCQPQRRERELQTLLHTEASRPFNLARGPLFRVLLLKLDRQEYVLALTLHHIISDGWSISILVRELTTLYRALLKGEASPLAPLSIHYADYAVWQRQWLQGEILREQIRYWMDQLSEAQAVELSGDYPRSQAMSHRGGRYEFHLDAQLTQGLSLLSRREGVTLFMTLLAGFQILLARLSGQQDIVVGTDSANRSHLATEHIIGFFINLLALRTRIVGTLPFQDLLQLVREMVLGAYLHQSLPFEMVVEHLRLDRENHRTPLVNVLLVVQNVPSASIELPDLTVSLLDNGTGATKFDLALFATEGPVGLHFAVDYSTDLFEEATIAKMMRHYEVLLQNIVAHPEAEVADLEIYSEEEKHLHNTYKKKSLENQLSKLRNFKA